MDRGFSVQNERGAPGGSRLRGLVLTVLLCAALVFLTLAVAVHLEGARDLIAKWMHDRTGLPVSLAETRYGWPCHLAVEGAVSATNSACPGSISVRRLSLGLGPGLRWRVRAAGCDVRLVQRDDAAWTPRLLASLGEARSVSDAAAFTRPFRDRVILDVSDATVRWFAAGGEQRALLEGASLAMLPVRLPDRRFTYYRLRAEALSEQGREPVRGAEWEWLESDDGRVIAVSASARTNAPGAGPPLWRGAGAAAAAPAVRAEAKP